MRIEQKRNFIIQISYYCILAALIFVSFKYVLPMLMPFLLGFLFAFLLKPIISLVEKHAHLPRKPVAVLLMLLFYVLAGTVCILLGTRIITAVGGLFGQMPAIYADLLEPALMRIQGVLADMLKNLDPAVAAVVSGLGESLTSSLAGLISTISQSAIGWVTNLAASLPSFFVKFLITIVVSFFCVVDYFTITSFLVRQLPERWRHIVFSIKEKGIDVIFQFGRAYAILIGITFCELLIGFSLLRVENAFLMALVIAFVDILPVVGTGTILIPWGIAELVLGNFPFAIGILIVYLIITVVRQMLEPRVVGQQIGLYPLVTLICMFVGTYLFGALGLFGLPIIATTLLQLDRSGEIHLFRYAAQTESSETSSPAENNSAKPYSGALWQQVKQKVSALCKKGEQDDVAHGVPSADQAAKESAGSMLNSAKSASESTGQSKQGDNERKDAAAPLEKDADTSTSKK